MALWIHKKHLFEGFRCFCHVIPPTLSSESTSWFGCWLTYGPHLNCHSVDRLDIDPPFSHPWISGKPQQERYFTLFRQQCLSNVDKGEAPENLFQWWKIHDFRILQDSSGIHMLQPNDYTIHYTLHTMIRYPCSVQMCVVTMHTCHSRVFTIHTIHTSGGCPPKYQVIIYEIYDNITHLPLKYAAKELFKFAYNLLTSFASCIANCNNSIQF